MVPSPRSSVSSSLQDAVEDWLYLEGDVLRSSRSRKVCLTCYWFRHVPTASCIPLLTSQLNQGLLVHGEHLTRRCHGWTEDMARQWGWCPEVS
jgi:hypothetical protein